MPDQIDTPIAQEAQDLLPETWLALYEASSFGPAALVRRYESVVDTIFGSVIDRNAQLAFPGAVIRYAGKMLALRLIDPAIDYWSKQILSQTIGDRESSTYKDRVEDLKQLKKDWTAELAGMFPQVQSLLPVIAQPAQGAPAVAQVGTDLNTQDNPRLTGTRVNAWTPYPGDLPPVFGPPGT